MEINTLRRYFRIWRRLAIMQTATAMTARAEFIAYLISKVIRLGFFFFFALSLFSQQKIILGYSPGEMMLFLGAMTIIDMSLQLFFRGLMAFSESIRNGYFDTVLVRPIHPLFWASLRMFDPMDFATVPVAIGFMWYAVHLLPTAPSTSNIFLAILMLACGFVIAFAVNLLTAALSFWTYRIENAYWLYRDLSYASRMPPEAFPLRIQQFFFFIIPILVCVSLPAKALMGRLHGPMIIWALIASIIWICLATSVWRRGLQRYTSASS